MGKSGRLTDAEVKAAKPVAGRVVILKDGDVPGLVVRVSSRGKLWACWYRVRGTGEKGLASIGRYGDEWSLDAARDAAREIRRQARAGIHPRQAEADKLAEASASRKAQAAARAAMVSVLAVVRDWLDHRKPELAPATLREYERCYRVYLEPAAIVSEPAATVPKVELQKFIDGLARQRGKALARSVHRMLRAAFGWAAEMEMIAENRMMRVRVAAPTRRKRVLSDAELAAYSKALDKVPALPAAVLRLQLLTAVRFPSELLQAKWVDVDLQAKLWKLPAATRKGGVEHLVPLSTAAVELLKSLETIPQEPPRPGRPGGRASEPTKGRVFGPIVVRGQCDWWFAKAEAVVRAECGTDAYTPHDIRRSVADGIVRLGIAPWPVADAILGHTIKGIAATYVRSLPLSEMAAALEKWGQHIAKVRP